MTKVLVVDDHPIVLQGCRRILEGAGCAAVYEASDVATGYKLYLSQRPTWSSSIFPCGILASGDYR
jgi:two-component system invasion response regulator UvrY